MQTPIMHLKDYFSEFAKRAGAYGPQRKAINQCLMRNRYNPYQDLHQIEAGNVVSKNEVRGLIRQGKPYLLERNASSSGTTGSPLVFAQPLSAIQREQAYIDWIWGLLGFNKSSRVAVTRGISLPQLTYRTGKRLIVSGDRWGEKDLIKKWNAIREFSPDYIHCYPSVLQRMLHYCIAKGLPIDVNVKGVFAGSEAIDEDQVSFFRNTLGAETIAWYGQSEQIALAVRETDSSYSFFPGYSDVAFLPDSSGWYEIAGRSRLNPTFSNFWYRTGDYCQSYHVAHSDIFGIHVIKVIGLAGRRPVIIRDKNGSVVPFNQLLFGLHSREWSAIDKYCFVQQEPGVLFFCFSPFRITDALKSDIGGLLKNIRKRLGKDFDIHPIQLNIDTWNHAEKWSYLFGSIDDFENTFSCHWEELQGRVDSTGKLEF